MGADLFPEIQPHATGMLDLDQRHAMYWEVSGNPNGVPVVFLHGGPGAATMPVHRRFFDPAHYRIVLFDQRGAGRSTPAGDVEDNTTAHLIADMERLRTSLGIEQWILFGGSWGSALALAYGQAHPERCRAMVLRGMFLCRDEEVDWFLHGMGRFFPEEERRFAEAIPQAERGDLLAAYHRRLMDGDPLVHMPAARAWSRYEGACSTLLPARGSGYGSDQGALRLARLEVHYFVNRFFMEKNALLDNLARLNGIPAVVAQGRYDMVCPVTSADMLVRAWPGARLEIVADAGHSAMEPGIRAVLINEMNRLAS
ncbi:MAG: prolyl aminopeptidase [Alphaproteobacteria bacterium]